MRWNTNHPQQLPWLSRIGQKKFLSLFLKHSEENVSVKAVFAIYFATGSDTASCQAYEDYEFVECLLEKTQITDLTNSTHEE